MNAYIPDDLFEAELHELSGQLDTKLLGNDDDHVKDWLSSEKRDKSVELVQCVHQSLQLNC